MISVLIRHPILTVSVPCWLILSAVLLRAGWPLASGAAFGLALAATMTTVDEYLRPPTPS